MSGFLLSPTRESQRRRSLGSQVSRSPDSRGAVLRRSGGIGVRCVRGNLEIWNPENLPRCAHVGGPSTSPGRASPVAS